MRSKPGSMIPLMMFVLLITLLMAGPAHAVLNSWASVGPPAGRVWSLAIDPTNTSVLYAATSGGLFKSSNAGGSWDMNTALGSTYISTIAINPNDTSIIYVGMSTGVSKTINGGTSWDLVSTGIPAGTAIKSIVINPADVTTIYVATYSKGVYKSAAGGAWSQVNNNLTNLNVLVLVIDPLTPATLYAGTDGGGVFKSTTSGANWGTVNTGLTDPNKNIFALAIDPQTPANLYLATYSGGVFKSTTGGASWGAVNTGLTNTYVRALAINPVSTGILYAGTLDGGVFKGDGGSGNWSEINTGLTNYYILSLAIDPESPATVYAGTNGGGVFKITFANFTLTSGFSGNGRGTVTSDPTGLACNSNCSHPFEFASYVTLTGTAADYSTFDGWTGACTGSSCGLLMDADRTIGAIFNLDTVHKALIPYPAQYFYFSTLQAAYNAATSSIPVRAWGTDFTEQLNANLDKDVTIRGGFNAAYSANSGYTTLHGRLNVSKGTLTVERLVIK